MSVRSNGRRAQQLGRISPIAAAWLVQFHEIRLASNQLITFVSEVVTNSNCKMPSTLQLIGGQQPV